MSPMMRNNRSATWCARSMVSEKRMGFMILRYIFLRALSVAAKVLKKN